MAEKIEIEKMTYVEVKRNIKQIFRNLDGYVYHLTIKKNGKAKLKELLDVLGIETEITEKGYFNISFNKTFNFFEKELLDVLEYRECAICHKFTYSPFRSIHNYTSYSTYGESFFHIHKNICDKCFQPILEQWKKQLEGIRERWVKTKHPDWKKDETGTRYIDDEGNTYPV